MVDLTKLEGFQAATEKELEELKDTADLNSADDMAKVSRLQAVLALLPGRLEKQSLTIEGFAVSLERTCDETISAELSPMRAALEEEVRAKTDAALAPHIPVPQLRAQAVAQSPKMQDLNGYFLTRKSFQETAEEYAVRILAANEKIQKIREEMT